MSCTLPIYCMELGTKLHFNSSYLQIMRIIMHDNSEVTSGVAGPHLPIIASLVPF